MSDAGDYETEMFRRTHLDDATIERLLAGQHVADQEMLNSFVEDTQLATSSAGVQPNETLAAIFAEGFSTENGDLLVTAASNVPGPAPQAAGLPKRRKNMLALALSKLAALGLAAKIGAATGALALTGTAAAFTGTLPAPVEDVVERTGIEIPGGRSAEHRQDADHRDDDADDDAVDVETADAEDGDRQAPAQSEFGTDVSDDARSGAPTEDGAQFGEDVSTDARETHQPATTPTAESNPGTEYRPETTPTAENNPGTEYRPETTPTAEDNAGTEYRPETTPTAESNPGTSRRP